MRDLAVSLSAEGGEVAYSALGRSWAGLSWARPTAVAGRSSREGKRVGRGGKRREERSRASRAQSVGTEWAEEKNLFFLFPNK
jgi:hypothetical protein